MTVKELAKLSGVSAATISRYFNNSQTVSKNTADLIEDTLSKYGLQDEFQKKNMPKSIAVLFPRLKLDFIIRALDEIIKQSVDHNYTIHYLPQLHGSHETLVNQIKSIKPYGILSFTNNFDEDTIKFLQNNCEKLVFFNSPKQIEDTTTINMDIKQGAFDAIEHLINLGHKNIVILSGHPKVNNVSYKLLQGCKKAFEHHGLYYNENMVIYGNQNCRIGYHNVMNLISGYLDFSAVFAFTDQLALGAIQALQEYRFSIPRDVSVVGFGDTLIADKVKPLLTSVHHPVEEIVAETLRYFSDPQYKRNIVIPHYISVRNSSGKESSRKLFFNEKFS